MSKITSEDLDYICDALVKAFTVDRHIAVEPDAINEIRRLARLGLLAEERVIPASQRALNFMNLVSSQTAWKDEKDWPERDALRDAIAKLPKGAQ